LCGGTLSRGGADFCQSVEPVEALRTLLDDARAGLPLPPALAESYGGPLDLAPQTLYSNFVSSLDGVVALGVPGVSSGAAISGRNAADRFVMALLRACASCVLVGASTVRDEPGILWDAGFVAPDWTEAWAALRSALALPAHVVTAVVTASGRVDLTQPVFERHALLYTTDSGARRLDPVPGGTDAVALAGERLDLRQVVADLRLRGHARILTEGGPTLIGSLLEHGLLDTAFLTISPVLAGRDGSPRDGMVKGVELLPERPLWGRLRSVKAAGSHLFLQYRLEPAG
jgi:riboflavin biosynthesis pyrimidine reductase